MPRFSEKSWQSGLLKGFDVKKAVVTGGGGFIGLAVVRLLVSAGVETSVVCRGRYPELERLGVEHLQGDIRDKVFLDKAFKEADTVFHVAAKAGIWGDWDDYYSINVIGTGNVISSCLDNQVASLVYTSTPSVVFDRRDIEGGDERLPYATRFLCHYAHTKVIAEQAVLAANSDRLRTTALRPHLVWGPFDTNLIPRLVERARSGSLKQVGDGRNRVDISYIDNVATAHILAAENLNTKGTAAGKPYFISQGEPVNLWDWINELLHRLDIPGIRKKVPFRVANMAGMVLEKLYSITGSTSEPVMTRFLAEQFAKSHWFSIENASRDFGYFPAVSTSEGVDRLVEWVRSSGI